MAAGLTASHCGIVMPSASIQTQLVDIPISNLILRPTELIMEAGNVNLDDLMVGGNVTKLISTIGSKQYSIDPACSWDLGPHWRFSSMVKTTALQLYQRLAGLCKYPAHRLRFIYPVQ